MIPTDTQLEIDSVAILLDKIHALPDRRKTYDWFSLVRLEKGRYRVFIQSDGTQGTISGWLRGVGVIPTWYAWEFSKKCWRVSFRVAEG